MYRENSFTSLPKSTVTKTKKMDKQKSIATLNTLIETNHDRIAGYETAAEETRDIDLRILFSHFMQTSKECKQELASEVLRLGGVPAEPTKTGGQLLRVWMEYMTKTIGNDRKSILRSCEFGEDMAVETYNKALRNNIETMSAEQHDLLNVQHACIRSERQQVKDMKDTSVRYKY